MSTNTVAVPVAFRFYARGHYTTVSGTVAKFGFSLYALDADHARVQAIDTLRTDTRRRIAGKLYLSITNIEE